MRRTAHAPVLDRAGEAEVDTGGHHVIDLRATGRGDATREIARSKYGRRPDRWRTRTRTWERPSSDRSIAVAYFALLVVAVLAAVAFALGVEAISNVISEMRAATAP
jgi:hypothetical protein